MHDQYIQLYQSENTRDQMSFETALHRKITPHTMTTTTSQKDHIVFKNYNVLLAFKGLNAITLAKPKKSVVSIVTISHVKLRNYSNHRVKPHTPVRPTKLAIIVVTVSE